MTANLTAGKLCIIVVLLATHLASANEPARVYHNRLELLKDAKPLLNDHPEFVQPIEEVRRYEAPILVNDDGADLSVRGWRFSYNARGIIEMPNRLRADKTAVIMVHPWGIDDGQGWKTPGPAGACDFCTPTKNHLVAEHTRKVIDPFLKTMRGEVSLIMYSLIAPPDPIRKKLYRTFDYTPTAKERAEAKKQLTAKLQSLPYKGEPLVQKLRLSKNRPVIDYFRLFPGLSARDRYNGKGFWNVPVPVTADVTVHRNDVLIFDQEGYEPLKKFLNKHDIRHVLLTGYATDMCFSRTTAGYENLSKDFNVFLVGDATLATFPANNTPRYATNTHISFASINPLITQVSWVKKIDD